jgi:translocation and assembly module TamA
VGDKLHHGKYESLKSYILSIALQRGYLDGRLLENSITINEDYDYASIKITYESGTRYRFGDVSFNNFELDETLLSSLIPFKHGEYYNTKKFHQLQHQLQSTQYFSNVHVTHAEKIQGNNIHQNTIPINAALTPAKSHQVDFGIGYATDTQFRLSVGWKTPLINQNGHYQETKIEYSPLNPTGKFIYNIPLSHPTNDLLRFKVNIENDDFADLTTKFYSVQIGHVFT